MHVTTLARGVRYEKRVERLAALVEFLELVEKRRFVLSTCFLLPQDVLENRPDICDRFQYKVWSAGGFPSDKTRSACDEIEPGSLIVALDEHHADGMAQLVDCALSQSLQHGCNRFRSFSGVVDHQQRRQAGLPDRPIGRVVHVVEKAGVPPRLLALQHGLQQEPALPYTALSGHEHPAERALGIEERFERRLFFVTTDERQFAVPVNKPVAVLFFLCLSKRLVLEVRLAVIRVGGPDGGIVLSRRKCRATCNGRPLQELGLIAE